MKKLILFTTLFLAFHTFSAQNIDAKIITTKTVDSLGACQGVFVHQNSVYLYGDREVGVIRKYKISGDSLQFSGEQVKFSIDGKNTINHPTGIALDKGKKIAFIGNSARLNKEGTKWKASIFVIDWEKLFKTKNLKSALLNEVSDDEAVQGSRPEMVTFNGTQCVATSDYGPKSNEVRLYDYKKLAKAKSTKETGVLVYKFSCSPWVQNLNWIADKKILVLVQNQIEGKFWRLNFLDLAKSIKAGHEVSLKTIDFNTPNELEGFAMSSADEGIAVTSSRKNNFSKLRVSFGK